MPSYQRINKQAQTAAPDRLRTATKTCVCMCSDTLQREKPFVTRELCLPRRGVTRGLLLTVSAPCSHASPCSSRSKRRLSAALLGPDGSVGTSHCHLTLILHTVVLPGSRGWRGQEQTRRQGRGERLCFARVVTPASLATGLRARVVAQCSTASNGV